MHERFSQQAQETQEPLVDSPRSPHRQPDDVYALVAPVIQTVVSELDHDPHTPFSDPAFQRLKTNIAQHIHDLVIEAVNVARRHGVDTISVSHVDQASNHLVTGRGTRWDRLKGALGGILFGIGASPLIQMIWEPAKQHPALAVIASVILCIVGTFLLALGTMKD